ncbi:MAG: M23 family metallopeptidase [Desulfobacterales bacterium]|nr:M23 family metallopeptidase [Desulfobacterales bacterium]
MTDILKTNFLKYFFHKKIIVLFVFIGLVTAAFFRCEKKPEPPQLANDLQPPKETISPIRLPLISQQRVTKKEFGQLITPENSPVQPERFSGYHTGVDFKIFPKELTTNIEVHAICTGKVVLKKTVSGYGGVLVQACQLDGKPITVTYGHLKLSSLGQSLGQEIATDEVVGILGSAHSQETDGERKHLHLSFHKGTAINVRGYVNSSVELSAWLDPCLYVCLP